MTARDSLSGEVSSCACRFCIVFGREGKVGSKRKATEHCKYFTSLRVDNYVQHLQQQHPLKWDEYNKLNAEDEKENFFKNNGETPFINTLEAHFEKGEKIFFSINKSIVENIIGGLFFHPDDIEGINIIAINLK